MCSIALAAGRASRAPLRARGAARHTRGRTWPHDAGPERGELCGRHVVPEGLQAALFREAELQLYNRLS